MIEASGVPAAGEREAAGGREARGEGGYGSGIGAFGDLGQAGEGDQEMYGEESDDGRAQQRGRRWGQADAVVFSGEATAVWSLRGQGPDGLPRGRVVEQEARARDAQARLLVARNTKYKYKIYL